MNMATDNDRRDFRRLVFFSLGGICVGLAVAGLIALLINKTIAPNHDDDLEIANDSVVVTFYIREDAKWPDGTPITADDVVSSYNAVLLNDGIDDGMHDEQRFPDDMVLLCEKVDEYVVKFTMSAASRDGLDALRLDVMPKSRLAERIRELDSGFPEEVLGETLIIMPE